jgi:hypothetical protein
MNPEIKKIWAEALRSGKYKQGQNYLRRTINDEDRFCCLGVLANECLADHWGRKIARGHWYLSGDVHEQYEMIPLVYLNKFEITLDNAKCLAEMNDDKFMNFNQIADWIEKNL